MSSRLQESPVRLTEELKGLGLNRRQISSLAGDLTSLPHEQRAFALALARRSGSRAALALRTAADALRGLEPGSKVLKLLLQAEPGAALAQLSSLPELGAALGNQGLYEWLSLAAALPSAAQARLAGDGPRLWARLKDRASQRLAMHLALALASERMSLLESLHLAVQAAQRRGRPRVLLGLALDLARETPGAARRWLKSWDQSPARRLDDVQLERWVNSGLRNPRTAEAYFDPQSLTGMARADLLSGALSTARLTGWLGPYASVHAGCEVKIAFHDQDPTLPFLDQDAPGQMSLPRRLDSDLAGPVSLLRAMTLLGAHSRRLGLFELERRQVAEVLSGAGRQAPDLPGLSPPALFCAGFGSPNLARLLLALALEENLIQGKGARLPGLARDLAHFRLARALKPRFWPGLEPGRRLLGLAAHALAQGSRPAQAVISEWKPACEIASQIQKQAPGSRALELMALAADLYQRLREIRPGLQQRLPQTLEQQGSGGEGPGGDRPAQAPSTPLSSMGQGPDGAPPPWNRGRDRGSDAEEDVEKFTYPEWDPAQSRLVPDRTTVIQRPAPQASAAEFLESLKTHAGLARRLERSFLSLAPSRPSLTGKNLEGSELDLEALITETAEARTGLAPRGRVFRRRTPQNRRVSCGVLWDISGSTKQNLRPGEKQADRRRIVAAAREALALFAMALDTAGDEYALWAFSGVGAGRVDFYLLKDFDQPLDHGVHRRLAGLSPQAQNRDGAAIRHAAHLLSLRPSRQRLLILISDGRPDDYGYGPEVSGRDLPLALTAAKSAGVRPMVILLTPQGRRPHEAYLAGPHLVLKDVEGLSLWLPLVYRRLMG